MNKWLIYLTILIGIYLNNVESDIYNILCDKCEHKLEYLSKCDICDIPLKKRGFEIVVAEKSTNYIVEKFKSIYDYIKQKIYKIIIYSANKF